MPYHQFHMVNLSPWPIMLSFSLFSSMISITTFIYTKSPTSFILNSIILMVIMFQWWRDIIRESTFQGYHSNYVIKGLKIGMLLFIASEVMFFLSFFWTFFHSSLSPNIEIGSQWPPMNISTFNPSLIPLLNTIILISSGVTITYSHHNMLNFNLKKSLISLFTTIILGMYFSILQMWEYIHASFSISDCIYGSIFFVSTGFHGIHVIIGTLFISTSWYRMKTNHFSSHHHLGFEMSAWYWHFVDIIWLFLYSMLYWWGN